MAGKYRRRQAGGKVSTRNGPVNCCNVWVRLTYVTVSVFLALYGLLAIDSLFCQRALHEDTTGVAWAGEVSTVSWDDDDSPKPTQSSYVPWTNAPRDSTYYQVLQRNAVQGPASAVRTGSDFVNAPVQRPVAGNFVPKTPTNEASNPGKPLAVAPSASQVGIDSDSSQMWNERQDQPVRASGSSTVDPAAGKTVQIVAQVGERWILAGEIAPLVDLFLRKHGYDPGDCDPQLRKMATFRVLEDVINFELLYQDARRHIPPEKLKVIEERIGEYFDEKELPRRLEQWGAVSSIELDRRLRELGSSLDQQKRLFIEQQVGTQWLYQQVGQEANITPDELLRYYHEHIHEFETPARAHWEEIYVDIPRYSDGSLARYKLGYVGNLVMSGMSIEEALKQQPPGEPRCEGGDRGWVEQGSMLVDPTLEKLIFGLPVGALSQIIRTENRYHIVRVIERQEAKRTPFEEAQAEIRQRILAERRQKALYEKLAELRKNIPVQTAFDQDSDVVAWRRMMENQKRR